MAVLDQVGSPVVLGGSKSLTLRRLRWSRGVSIEQCAAAMGMDVRQFVLKESGRSDFTPEEFAELALLLDLVPESLDKLLS